MLLLNVVHIKPWICSIFLFKSLLATRLLGDFIGSNDDIYQGGFIKKLVVCRCFANIASTIAADGINLPDHLPHGWNFLQLNEICLLPVVYQAK